MRKRIISMLLAMVMLIGTVPAGAIQRKPEAGRPEQAQTQEVQKPEAEKPEPRPEKLREEELPEPEKIQVKEWDTGDAIYKSDPSVTYSVYYRVLEDGTIAITGIPGSIKGQLILPEEIDGRPVTRIDTRAFEFCRQFTGELKLPSSLKSIGGNAFKGCDGFTGNLKLPSGLTTIGREAFNGCNGFTGELIIPDNVTTIGEYAFKGCDGFTGNLKLSDSLISIDDGAFGGCYGLTGNLKLPSGLTTIGNNVFNNSGSFTGNLTIPDSLTSIGQGAFAGCTGFTGDLIMPGVTWIDWNAFSGCSGFTGELSMPSVETISPCAFQNCSGFTGKLTLSDSLTSIGHDAFQNCSGLTGELTLPDGITSIGNFAFKNCSGFTGELKIPDSVTGIGQAAFAGCSGFTGELIIPPSVESIRSYAFQGCSGLTGELTIPNSVLEVGNSAFQECSGLTGVILQARIKAVPYDCFSSCTSLKQIYLPRKAIKVRDSAFKTCDALRTVYYEGSEQDRSKISIDRGNDALTGADWYYNCTASDVQPLVSRDMVLILDNSKSMAGRPLEVLRQTAVKFCYAAATGKDDNRVAVLTSESQPALLSDFTNDQEVLKKEIGNLAASGENSNLEAAVRKADEMLSASGAKIKNVIIMTDGIPTAGAKLEKGPFTAADHKTYQYGNALYRALLNVHYKYNVFTMGFFHNLSAADKEFGARLLKQSQNMGYYEVTDPANVDFIFGEITNAPTQSQLQDLYVAQHLTYYEGKFRDEVQRIAFPNRDGSDYGQGNTNLSGIVYDATDDGVVKTYNFVSKLNNVLNLNFQTSMDASISNYELILADIVTSSYYINTIKETFATTAAADVVTLGKTICDHFTGEDRLQKLAEESNMSLEAVRKDWQKAAQVLDDLNREVDHEKYWKKWGELSIIVDKYVKGEKVNQEILDELASKSSIGGKTLSATKGALLDGAIATASEVINYYVLYDAYTQVSSVYLEALNSILNFARQGKVGIEASKLPSALDAAHYSEALQKAIRNFMKTVEDADQMDKSAQGIALKVLKSGEENLIAPFTMGVIDILADAIPAVGTVNRVRKVLGFVGSAVMITVNLSTKVDDRAYSAAMICHLAHLINYAQQAAESQGNVIAQATDVFPVAARFDECIRIWRCSSMMLCDFGIEYEQYRFEQARKQLTDEFHRVPPSIWHATAISIAAVEKEVLSKLHCHNLNLSYDPNTGHVDLGEDMDIVVVACPVAVRVTNENGQEIALLAGNEQRILPGYEAYFHQMQTEQGGRDSVKLCYIPNNWNVSFEGTGSGSMSVCRADVVNGKPQNEVASPDLVISEQTRGHISDGTEQPVVVVETMKKNRVEFDAGGGTTTDHALETGEDGRLPRLPEAVRERYSFEGWYTEDGRKVTTDTVFTVSATVRARWKAEGPTVTVTVDGKQYEVAVGTPLSDALPELTPKAGHTLFWCENGIRVNTDMAVQRDMVLESRWEFTGFDDVKSSDWFYEGVRYTTARGIFSGISATQFGSKIAMTRAMVVQVLYSMAGKPWVEKTHQFSDVKDSDWFADAVAWALENGVSSGYPGGRFAPNDEVNREQLAVMLHGYVGKPKAAQALTFTDVKDISDWARPAMEWAVEKHMIGGIPGNRILPKGPAERSQGAVIMMNFHQLPK